MVAKPARIMVGMRYLGLFVMLLVMQMAWAFPRVGVHQGFTRLVFDVPTGTQFAVGQNGNTFRIGFNGVKVAPASGAVNSYEVRDYRVAVEGNMSVAYIQIQPGVSYKIMTIPGETGQQARVVVDFVGSVPTPGEIHPVVVIDPGHGGSDPGAVGFVVEKELTLDLAFRLKRYLEARGIEVILTRETDTHLSTAKVQDLSMRAGMADPRKTLFVSIHANSAARPAQGIETYYLGRALEPGVLSLAVKENGGGEVGSQLTQQAQNSVNRIMADLIAQTNLDFSRRLASSVQGSLLQSTGGKDRGVQSAPFYVIRNARIPAILVEVGFVNHPVEGKNLATGAYRDRVVEGIGGGILNFLGDGAFVYR